MKTWARILGTAATIKGMILIVRPGLLVEFTKDYLAPHLPDEVADVVEEYGKLSETSLRALGAGVALMGITVLCLLKETPEEDKS